MDLPEFKSSELLNAKLIPSSITSPLKMNITPAQAVIELRKFMIASNKERMLDIGTMAASKQVDPKKYLENLTSCIKLYIQNLTPDHKAETVDNKKHQKEMNLIYDAINSLFSLINSTNPNINVEDLNSVILGVVLRNL